MTPQGWQCPECKTVYAPHVEKCECSTVQEARENVIGRGDNFPFPFAPNEKPIDTIGKPHGYTIDGTNIPNPRWSLKDTLARSWGYSAKCKLIPVKGMDGNFTGWAYQIDEE